MLPLTARLSLRFGRWPRRVAVLICMLLAAVTALHPATAEPSSGPVVNRLAAGQVAVTVSVAAASTPPNLRADLQVGVVSRPDIDQPGTARLVADHLRVLSVVRPNGGFTSDDTVTVVIATDRATAVRVLQTSSTNVQLLVDEYP